MPSPDLPSTVFVAVGAVLAAIITGAISFVNLVISKDQKISEFRQEWINELRDDIAEYEGNIIAISAAWQITDITKKGSSIEDDELNNFYKLIADDVRDCRKALRRIVLRLNPKEHKIFIDKINEIDDLLSNPPKLKDTGHIDELLKQATSLSHTILGKEWKRVKRGEVTFYVTKYSALFVFSLLIIASIIIGFKHKNLFEKISNISAKNGGVTETAKTEVPPVACAISGVMRKKPEERK